MSASECSRNFVTYSDSYKLKGQDLIFAVPSFSKNYYCHRVIIIEAEISINGKNELALFRWKEKHWPWHTNSSLPTPDYTCTCVRTYLHVSDIVDVEVLFQYHYQPLSVELHCQNDVRIAVRADLRVFLFDGKCMRREYVLMLQPLRCRATDVQLCPARHSYVQWGLKYLGYGLLLVNNTKIDIMLANTKSG